VGKIKIVQNLFTLTLADSEVSTTFAAANTGVAQLVEPLLPCKEIKPQIVDETVCGFISYIKVHHQCPIKIGTFQKLNKSVPIDRP